MLHLKFFHHFVHVKQINDVSVDESNHIYIVMPM